MSGDQIEQLAQAYQLGATVTVLAARFRISKSTVIAHLDRQGIQRRTRTGPTGVELQEAVSLYESGLTLRAIGRRLGFNEKTIRTYLARAGVVIRPSNRSGLRN